MLEWVYGLFLLVLAIGTIRNVWKSDSTDSGPDRGYGTFNGG
jgi:hypothetical protein